jgi:predicted secreted protein
VQSLAELRWYLNAETDDLSLLEFRRMSLSSASIKSERRRSLPARNSMASVDSETSLATPEPDVTDFQTRRRRAAKLTHFFGVDYRDLIHDVLDSIERGVEEEKKRGTLRPDEFEVHAISRSFALTHI